MLPDYARYSRRRGSAERGSHPRRARDRLRPAARDRRRLEGALGLRPGGRCGGGARRRSVSGVVAGAGGEPVGWASLVPRGETGWLEDLWVEPAWIGRGVGGQLFENVARRGGELGGRRLGR